MRSPTYQADDTEFTVLSTRFPEEHPRLWEAINEWCRFHDIDPLSVPMCSTLRRNVAACRVEYVQIVRDHLGHAAWDSVDRQLVTRPAVSQGEVPPLPFPTNPETL